MAPWLGRGWLALLAWPRWAARGGTDEDGACPTGVPPLMRLDDGRTFDVIDDVLEPDVLKELAERLAHGESMRADQTRATRAGTVWLELDRVGVPAARTAIERVIRLYAKAALGADRFGGRVRGVDYWWQSRRADKPKEYHADSDTDLCHAAERRGGECSFAVLSSVFYVSPAGAGPTVIFNQSFNALGLSPRIPRDVIVIPARANRLVVFRGTLYHGVLHPLPGGPPVDMHSRRLTLLANFWSNKPEESRDAPQGHADDEAAVQRLGARLGPEMAEGAPGAAGAAVCGAPYGVADAVRALPGLSPQVRLVDHVEVEMPKSFDGGFDAWQQQRLPVDVLQGIKSSALATQASWEEVPAVLRYKVSGVEAQIPKAARVPSWALWS